MRFTPHHVVVAVEGDVDPGTATDLRRVLGALVDRRHADVVLDLGGVGFLDGSGIEVIVTAASRLGAAGGRLTLRSPSRMTLRLLELTSVGDLVTVEMGDPADDLAAEQGVDEPQGSDQRAVEPVTRVAEEVRSPPSSPGNALSGGGDVLDAALRLVTVLARATVDGADGVSVSLERHGTVTTVAASDETIAQMDRDQYATGEGPCLSAAAEGRWFHVESLA